MLCLPYSKVNQLQARIRRLPLDLLPTSTPPLSVISGTGGAPCALQQLPQLSALHTAVYIRHSFSQFAPCVCSLRLPLYSHPADGINHTISLDSIYIREYAMLIFL